MANEIIPPAPPVPTGTFQASPRIRFNPGEITTSSQDVYAQEATRQLNLLAHPLPVPNQRLAGQELAREIKEVVEIVQIGGTVLHQTHVVLARMMEGPNQLVRVEFGANSNGVGTFIRRAGWRFPRRSEAMPALDCTISLKGHPLAARLH